MHKILILLAAVLVAGWLQGGESLAAGAPNATQTVSGGGVTVKATYTNIRSNENPRFEVALETHSVALDGYDLKSLALLRDDKGKSYSPTAIENKGGGHHRQIAITFPNESRGSKILELIIKDIAGVKERGFRWVLE